MECLKVELDRVKEVLFRRYSMEPHSTFMKGRLLSKHTLYLNLEAPLFTKFRREYLQMAFPGYVEND